MAIVDSSRRKNVDRGIPSSSSYAIQHRKVFVEFHSGIEHASDDVGSRVSFAVKRLFSFVLLVDSGEL